jgi:hypothetical protein
LNEKSVDDLTRVRKADARSFDLLFSFLRRTGYYLDLDRAILLKSIPRYEAFAWRVEERALSPGPRGKVGATAIYHQGIHALVAARFGHRRRGMPRMCLLNEAIGLGTAFYFSVAGLGKSRGKHAYFTDQILEECLSADPRRRARALRMLNDSMEDPYAGFCRTTQAAYSVLEASYTGLVAICRGADPARTWKAIARSVDAAPYFAFSRSYDLGVPSLYVYANCGTRSTAKDASAVRSCLELIREAGSFPELLLNLGAADRRIKVSSR